MFYDGNKFKLIDTGSYYYYTDIPGVNNFDDLFVYGKNMRKIMPKIFSNITDTYEGGDNFILFF